MTVTAQSPSRIDEDPASWNESRRAKGTLRDGQMIKLVPSYYTPSQISQWLFGIGYPTTFTEMDVSSGTFSATLENLGHLMRLHLLAFPFENTAMH
jgi:hypothetical protein